MTAHKEDPMMDSVADLASRVMTEADLPPPETKRWVMRRKAEVVAGVRCGLISLEEACRRYTLSVEEFLSWQRLIDSHGVRGLRPPGCRTIVKVAKSPRLRNDFLTNGIWWNDYRMTLIRGYGPVFNTVPVLNASCLGRST